jgi:ABC-type oligopeptide transport system substrate-binding subunit
MVYDDPHQVWHAGWNADHVDPHNFLHDGMCSGYNDDFFNDWEGEYASMVEAIADAPDEATRRAKIAEFSSRACTPWSFTLFRWDHGEYEALLQAALQEYDEETRREKYVRAEQILCETEAVLIPLFHYRKGE